MIANDIAAHLAAQGYGTLGTDIFIDQYPPSPDEAICVYGIGGGPPESTDSSSLEAPKFSVVVRSADPATAQAACEGIRQYLHRKALTIGENYYWQLRALLPEAIGLGLDETNTRTKYSCDFVAEICRSV